MKKLFFLIILISSFLWPKIGPVFANNEHGHESEIKEGRKLVESEISCDKLNDEQLEAIGEYLMEQIHPGESHEAMHKMMDMEEGTEYHKQFHINLAEMIYCGKGVIMNGGMMGGSGNSIMRNMMSGSNWGMGVGWNWIGWVFMILFWILIIVGIIALIKWLINQIKGETKSKSALDILERRYVKGEIDKKEFEEKKKDLS